MDCSRYLPEGRRIRQPRNIELTSSTEGLRRAAASGEIVEARAIRCDAGKNLYVDLGNIEGVIPYADTAIGAEDGSIRDIAIISLVGKPVCFKVISVDERRAVLSRRAAQEEALSCFMKVLRCGDVISARVTHLEPFGAFVDMGCGIISLIGIENISVSRISHPSDRFVTGQDIYAVVLAIDRDLRRVTLSHRELLGTWQENASLFKAGETVAGIVRGVEDYGIFIELTPNLSGLAEKKEGLKEGEGVSVYIKSILPERMKIKLLVIDSFGPGKGPSKLRYFITEGHIDHWKYSPDNCDKKVIERYFSD
ncbi:MAG: 30S ribosomal protein S1 [Clostridiales bacterium]|nr:30S ribosomal protein S1 [Clostridiales bacterium]